MGVLIFAQFGCTIARKKPVNLTIATTPAGATVEVKRGSGEYEKVGDSPVDITLERTTHDDRPRGIAFVLGIVAGLVTLGLGVAVAQNQSAEEPNETLRNATLATAGLAGLGFGLAFTDNSDSLPPKGFNEDIDIRFSKEGYSSEAFTLDHQAEELFKAEPRITFDMTTKPSAPVSSPASLPAVNAKPPVFSKPPIFSKPSAIHAPVLAVLDVHDPSSVFDAKILTQLTIFLNARMANVGYRTIPRSQIESAIKEFQRDSLSPCVDETCQIELGKAVAAEQTLAPSILHIGGQCIAAAGVYDLTTQAGINAVTVDADCSPQGLMKAFEEVARQLPPYAQASSGQPAPPDEAQQAHDDGFPSWALPFSHRPKDAP
ncbi:MAG: hypothetical protein AAFN74_23660 [Myxococcota bacterium]